jgi:hypothetical protein
VWIVAWGKILTNDSLRERGIILVDWCCLCRSGETVDLCYFIVILLMQCGVIFCLFGDSWVMLRIVIDLLFGWCNRFGKQSSAV